MHHDALWEEEKHFSWWVYSVFAGIFLVFSNTGLTLSLKIILTILLSISGIKLCHSALDIINSEQTYFTSALEKFKKHYTDNWNKQDFYNKSATSITEIFKSLFKFYNIIFIIVLLFSLIAILFFTLLEINLVVLLSNIIVFR